MRNRLLLILAAVLLAGWGASVLLGEEDPRRASAPGASPASRDAPAGEPAVPSKRPADPFGRVDDPFAWSEDREEELVGNAAQGFQHPLYTRVPGGAVATAQRVAAFRPLIERIANGAGHDPDTIEGMVYLESAGYPNARAGDTKDAVGLTQILAETGQNLLDMRVDVQRSAQLTEQIGRATRREQAAKVERLQAERRRVDERYDPTRALEATARYLTIAKDTFGRDDLAVVSYHMGIGNLTSVRERFGAGEDTSYAEIYFDSSPLRNERAYALLASFGDFSSTYLWRVEAAKDIMRRFRENPAALAERAEIITAKNSDEELLRPAGGTRRFATPDDIRDAYDDGTLVALDAADLAGAGVRIDRDMGEIAPRLGEQRELYRGLRPEALALLVYLARATETISGEQPLILTSTVRDDRYQRLLLRRNSEATAGYSLHTTGYALDLLRQYESREQARAFQFVLDRLQALNVIAWVREPAAIHLTVGPRATELLGLLER